MSNKARERKSYSQDFKLRMLKEYYESGSTKYSLCKKYSVDYVTFSRWERYFESKNAIFTVRSDRVRASGIYGTKEIRIIQGDRSPNGEREAPGGELVPTQGVGLLRVAQ